LRVNGPVDTAIACSLEVPKISVEL
jgi:hypothetical protein